MPRSPAPSASRLWVGRRPPEAARPRQQGTHIGFYRDLILPRLVHGAMRNGLHPECDEPKLAAFTYLVSLTIVVISIRVNRPGAA